MTPRSSTLPNQCVEPAVSEARWTNKLDDGFPQVAERAFWDVLSEGLAESPPAWQRLAALVCFSSSVEHFEMRLQQRVLDSLDIVPISSPFELHDGWVQSAVVAVSFATKSMSVA